MANADLTKTILGVVHVALKPLGFRKVGATFTRDLGEVIQIVNVQKSTSSDQGQVKLKANIGMWVKALAPVRAGVPDKENIWSAHWRVRIGQISPERTDLWWTASTSAEASAVGHEIARRLTAFALPALEEVSSVRSLQRLWLSESSPGLTDLQRAKYLRVLGGQSPN